MAAPPLRSLAWQNIASRLACRAVIFDARSLKRAANEVSPEADKKRQAALRAAGLGTASLDLRRPEELVAAGRVKDMLQKEIRDELKQRGLSPIGKPWEIKAKLEALLAAERREQELLSAEAESMPADGAASPSEGGSGQPASTTASASPPAGTAFASPSSATPDAVALRAKYKDKLRSKAGVSMLSSGGLASVKASSSMPAPHMRPILRVLSLLWQ